MIGGIFLLLFTSSSYAQEVKLYGVVTDENGNPLPGVSVIIKGTTIGSVSDLNGKWSISTADNVETLVFKLIGYLTQEVDITKQSEINVQLQPDVEKLDEVLIVGYGSVRKSDLTGSVASVKGSQVREFPVTSLDQGIQGRASGIQVTQASAAPGGGVTVRIRGANSISSGSEPLYVIDGFPVYPDNNASGLGGDNINVLSTLNPSDIESIEILKDASATSIYGSRGSNGVILITTRRGAVQEPSFSYDFSHSVQVIAKKYDLLTPQQYAEYQNLRAASRGADATYSNPGTVTGVNWQDAVLRNGSIQNHQIGIAGGVAKSKYYFSLGRFDNQGVILNSSFTRYSLRANLDTKILNDKVTISTTNSFTNTVNYGVDTDNGGTTGILNSITGGNPIVDGIRNARGQYNYFRYDGRHLVNPVAELEKTSNKYFVNRMLSNTSITIDIIPGLQAKTSIGFDLSNSARRLYYGKETIVGIQQNGALTEYNRTITNILNENLLTYKKTFADQHSVDAVVGYTYQSENNRYSVTEGRNFLTDSPSNRLQDALSTQPGSSGRGTWELISIISRVNYTLMNKYLFTATFRRDGSSRFGKNNKWANFPSFAVGWRVSDEDFMQNITFLNNMKLRISYGLTGNSEIPMYQSLSQLGTSQYSFNNSLVSGADITRIPNSDLKWETTAQLNIGADLGFLDGRLNVTLDYFHINTTDLLLNVRLPASIGFSQVLLNSGSLENKGFELGVDFTALSSGDFKWTINSNLSILRNKITDLGRSASFFSSGLTHTGARGSWVEAGNPIGVWRGLEVIGIWQSQSEIDENPSLGGDRPGYFRYRDANGDGRITSADFVIVGDPNPDFTWGLSQNFQYKNFDLGIFLRGVHGNDIRNLHASEHGNGTTNTNQLAVAFTDAWSSSNTSGTRPVVDARRDISTFSSSSSFYVEDGSFVRLQNVSLGYTFPSKINWLKKLRVYFSAQNLFVITNYTGLDPEVNMQGQSNLNRGDDRDAYPRARTFTVGASVTF